jgi:UDP-N-acetylmuramate--alanine ligase
MSHQVQAPPTAASPLDRLAGPAGKRLALVGAGGCGMRGLARLFLEAGWEVYGQDARPFAEDDPLLAAGLKPWTPGPAPAVSWVVRSAAVPAAEAHVQAATEAGARSLLYAEMLGEISRLRPVLAVAGSHGKTTCSAWIAYGMQLAGREVGWLVGAEVPQLPASARWGRAEEPLILESCEYARSFHHLTPAAVALTNIDAEHPDTYPGGLPEVEEAFAVFLGGTDGAGVVHAGPEAPDMAAATAARWTPCPELRPDTEVGLPGRHNRRNAALVAAVLQEQGLDEAQVRAALAGFGGAARRLETVGTLDAPRGVTLVSDYAHHPVEVAATLQAARERWSGRRVVAVFQPHQAQRFHAYRELFAPSLDEADALLLLEIYRARDPEELRASVEELVPELEGRRPDRPLAQVRDFDAGRKLLRSWLREDDVLLALGAGDVDAFLRELR